MFWGKKKGKKTYTKTLGENFVMDLNLKERNPNTKIEQSKIFTA